MEQALLIQGGTVIDGTGGGAVRADVRIENGQIEQIRPGLSPREGDRVLPAEGLAVCPGFIDAHCHTDM